MRFWDSSCLVPLVVDEPKGRASRDLFRADAEVVAWTIARHEVWAAICRKRREKLLGDDAFEAARRRLQRHADRWYAVPDAPDVRVNVDRLLEVHDLRAGDAFQLAAALFWCEGRARGRQFIAADDRLLGAAAAEGFTTIRPA